jgi:hypothetical protein
MKPARWLCVVLGASAWLVCGCEIFEAAPSSGSCVHVAQEIDPDERIAGVRAGDVLEPYFGTQTGVLRWEAGAETALTLEVMYEPGTPYHLGNVSRCEARAVYYHAHAQVTTDDSAFDDELSLIVDNALPGVEVMPETVLYFSAFSDWQWSPNVAEHLGVELERYSSSYLVFEVDWPPSAAAPRGGRVMLRGTLTDLPEVSDWVQVARLSF